MSIVFVAGNMLNSPKKVIAHGCNCLGFMGAGIAKSIRDIYPKEMMDKYEELCKTSKIEEIEGTIQVYETPNLPILVNMFTQRTIWGQVPASLDLIDKSCRALLKWALDNKIEEVAMPAIGAGLGGLNMEDVKLTVAKIFAPSKVRLVFYEFFEPLTSCRVIQAVSGPVDSFEDIAR
ncbi:macro domain-containing protein [Candidatus Nomurabacteria bacterium]|nr:macro domain-containing protein [Candidatus Nomurabacteria bacterium]